VFKVLANPLITVSGVFSSWDAVARKRVLASSACLSRVTSPNAVDHVDPRPISGGHRVHAHEKGLTAATIAGRQASKSSMPPSERGVTGLLVRLSVAAANASSWQPLVQSSSRSPRCRPSASRQRCPEGGHGREQPVGRWIDGQDPALRVGDDDCGSDCCENDVGTGLAAGEPFFRSTGS